MASVEIPAMSILIAFFLTYLALVAASDSAAQEKASGSVVVTGNVFCDACLEGRPSQNGYVISGASVALECRLNRKGLTVSVKGETDENGEFKVELPSNIFRSADQLSKCSVKPLKSHDNSCRIPSKSEPSSLTLLQSESNGVVTYSAGSFSYRHEIAPALCYRKGVLRMKRGRAAAENFEFGPASAPTRGFGFPPQPASAPTPDSGFSGFSTLAFPPQPASSPTPGFGFPPQPASAPTPDSGFSRFNTLAFPPQPASAPTPGSGFPPQPASAPTPDSGFSSFSTLAFPPQPASAPTPGSGVPPQPASAPTPDSGFSSFSALAFPPQ